MTTGSAPEALSADETALLAVLLETLIPPAPARRQPGAADVGFCAYVTRKALVPKVRLALEWLEKSAQERAGISFAKMELEARLTLAGDRTCTPLVEIGTHLLQCYYQSPAVLAAIGLPARPPFPEGFSVPEGDLMLLEPVYMRGKLYRDV